MNRRARTLNWRWLVAGAVAVAVVATGAALLLSQPSQTLPVAAPAPHVPPGSVDVAVQLLDEDREEEAIDELLRVSGSALVERYDVTTRVIDLLAARGRERDIDHIVTQVAAAPVLDIEQHVFGLEQIAFQLYEYNDLLRSSIVEEKLRILVNELVEADPTDLLLRLYQTRLWAGYLTAFPQWEMVGWLVRSIEDWLDDEEIAAPVRAELLGHQAQSFLERWEGRDPQAARLRLDRALALGVDNGWLYYLSGLWHLEYGDRTVGADQLELARQLMPDADEVGAAAHLSSVNRSSLELELLGEYDGVHFSLSPDGRVLCVVDRGSIRLVLVGEADEGMTLERSSIGEIGTVSWAPDGSRLAWLRATTAPGEGGPWTELVVAAPDGSQEQIVIPSGRFSMLEGLRWTPCSGEISTWGEPVSEDPAGVYVFDIVTGESELAFAKADMWCEDGADWDWSPDGGLLAVLAAGKEYPRANARVFVVTPGDEPRLAAEYGIETEWNPGMLAWSARGELITHWARDAWSVTPIKIQLMTATGEWIPMTSGRSLDSNPAWSPDGEFLAWFSRPLGSDDWVLVVSDRDRTGEAVYVGNWRWWRSADWRGRDTIAVGIGPQQVAVFRLVDPASLKQAGQPDG